MEGRGLKRTQSKSKPKKRGSSSPNKRGSSGSDPEEHAKGARLSRIAEHKEATKLGWKRDSDDLMIYKDPHDDKNRIKGLPITISPQDYAALSDDEKIKYGGIISLPEPEPWQHSPPPQSWWQRAFGMDAAMAKSKEKKSKKKKSKKKKLKRRTTRRRSSKRKKR